ncbi:MAG: trypsin-like serine protease, partial [Chloroflexota bacterium]
CRSLKNVFIGSDVRATRLFGREISKMKNSAVEVRLPSGRSCSEALDQDVDTASNADDIAVLEFTNNIGTSPPLRFPKLGSIDGDYIAYFVVGFGRSNLTDIAGIKNFAQLRPAELNEIIGPNVSQLKSNERAFVAVKGNADSCLGDSGGGLYGLNRSGELILIGVTSRSLFSDAKFCGSGGIYTAITPFITSNLTFNNK